MKGHERLLTRRPKPTTTESLNGYYVRLSEANGFGSPWHLLKRAGMEQHEWRTRGVKNKKLAELTGHRQVELDRLGYRNEDARRSYQLLGNPVSITDIDPENPKLCLHCVGELKYIEAHWDLTLMVGCPVHDRWSTVMCMTCDSKLGLYRPGLKRCQCGVELKNYDDSSLEVPVRSLLEILRSRTLGLLPFADFGSRLPILELHRLTLSTLLRVVNVIGMSSLVASKQEHVASPKLIVCTAAKTLSDWPSNFGAMLRALGRPSHVESDIRREFAPLYSGLFRRRSADQPEDLDFIRREFLDFISNQWGSRRADSKTLRRVRSQVEQKYLNASQLAKRLQVDPRTVRRHDKIRLLQLPKGPDATFAADSDSIGVAGHGTRTLMSLRRAAATIGIPIQVLRIFKESGYMKVRQQLPRQVGFPEEDVLDFKHNLIELGAQVQLRIGDQSGVTLGNIMRSSRYTADEKATLMHRIMRGEIFVIGILEPTVSGVLISDYDITRFIRNRRANNGGAMLTGLETAALLKCEFEAVVNLIHAGRLTGMRSSTKWLVAESSVDEFKETYMTVASVATAYGTSSRLIGRLCTQKGIAILSVGARPGAVRMFIRRCDRQKIENELVRPTNAKRNYKDAE
jgi:hypothetical protein